MSFQNNHRAVELEDSPGRKAPGKISRSSCSWAKGAWMSLSNTQSSRILQTSDDGGSTSTPGEAVAGIVCSHSKILLFYTKMKPFPVQLVPVALSLFHVAPWEGRASHSLCSHPFKYWSAVLEVPLESSPGWTDLTPSGFPPRAGSPALRSLWPSFGPPPVCPHLCGLWGPELGTVLQGRPDKCWVKHL